MSEHQRDEQIDLSEELSPAELAALDDLLAMPAVWDEPDPAVEDRVVAAIAAAAAAAPEAGPEPAPAPRSQPSPRRAGRSHRRSGGGGSLMLVGVAAAAALVAVVVVGALRGASDRAGEQVLAIRPPAGAAPLAPGAEGEARVAERGDGTRIRLDVRGLPPAPAGFYYEAWMRKNPQVGVSAGTFHLRGGGEEVIELWSGVSPRDYPLFTVTIQEEARPESSGRVLLSGRLG